MSIESRITPAQQAVLDGYTCERLTAHSENQLKIFRFFCKRNPHLAYNLRGDAWYEDKESRPNVYYVVKNPAGQIAMYFSLKCGVLFDPDYVQDVTNRMERSHELLEALQNRECQEWAKEHIELLRAGHRFIPAWKESGIRSDYYGAKSDWLDIKSDKKQEPNQKMIRVDEAFPAVELVHFCVNDSARCYWKKHEMGGNTLGKTLFWQFVVPKMLEINALVGCEYAYLFAADKSRDAELVNYYKTELHFDQMKHIGAIKPSYDFFCIFMCKRLTKMSEYRKNCLEEGFCKEEDPLGLADYRERFFEYFNYVQGSDIV